MLLYATPQGRTGVLQFKKLSGFDKERDRIIRRSAIRQQQLRSRSLSKQPPAVVVAYYTLCKFR